MCLDKTYQTSVLVRGQGMQTVLYLLVRELSENVSSSRSDQLAKRLASVFQVPIRRVDLSKSESRAMDDC
jgi:hypothetical protein